MKKILSIRTKAGVILIAALFIVISISSVMSVTRTITDSSDTIDTYIRNSNGNYWSVTGANLELAINDVSTFGTVWIGSDITLTSEIDMDGHDGVMLDFYNHEATLSGDISFINFTNCNYAGLRNVQINVATQTGSIIMFYAGTDANRVDYPFLSNVHIDNTGGQVANYNASGKWVYKEHNFTGIEFYADEISAAVGDYGRVFKGFFQHITIEGANVGMIIRTRTRGYVNGCTFINIYFDQYKHACIEFIDTSTTGGPNENIFYSIQSQTAVYSVYGLKNIAGEDNDFNDMLMWDFSISDSGIYAYWISSTAVTIHLDEQSRTMSDYVLDEGLGSIITCGNREFYPDKDYDYKFTVNAGTGYYYVRQGDYGQMPVSGTYDRDTDFQALLYAITNNDDIMIKLDNGTYIPDQFINFRGKNITIEGRDDHSTIIKCDAAQYASGLINVNSATANNITIRNIVFDGTDATGSSVGLYFSSSESMHGLTVENCLFLNWNAGTSRGIYINPSTDDIVTNVKIIDCEFYNCDYGVTLEGDSDPSLIQYADVSHNYYQECGNSIYCDWVRNSTISNNRIISTVASSDGITLDDSIDVIVDGNIIGVVDDGVIEIGGADYNMIYGNILRHSGDPITVVGANTNRTLNIN